MYIIVGFFLITRYKNSPKIALRVPGIDRVRDYCFLNFERNEKKCSGFLFIATRFFRYP